MTKRRHFGQANFLAVALFLQGCTAKSAPEEARDDPPDLDAFARETLQVSNYRLAQADLNEDGTDEILLYANGRENCGSGGCNLFVIAREKDGFRAISNITIANLPVRLLATSHNGWRDLAVTVSGGGIVEPFEARLPFDGEGYAENPSVPPATRIEREAGKELIAANPGDWPNLS